MINQGYRDCSSGNVCLGVGLSGDTVKFPYFAIFMLLSSDGTSFILVHNEASFLVCVCVLKAGESGG